MYEKRRLLEESDSDDDDDHSSEEDKFEYPDKKVAFEPYEEEKVSKNDRNA